MRIGGNMHKMRNIFTVMVLVLLIGGLSAFFVSGEEGWPEEEFLAYDTGDGPAAIEEVVLVGYPELGITDVRVYFGEGQVELIADSEEFQLRVFTFAVDMEQDMNIYLTAGEAFMVTPDFDMMMAGVPYSIDPATNCISFMAPFYYPETEALATLAWNVNPIYLSNTPLAEITYYGFEISRYMYAPYSNYISTEIFLLSDVNYTQTSSRKGWPIKKEDEIPDDGSNPPGGAPGPLYKGWPKKKGNITYWEYSGPGGFIKRAWVDTNGNGKKDPGEPDGYVGRCPYVPGDNVQAMGSSGATWTSEWRGHNERIVHKLKKIIGDDGKEKWVVESTHQTKQPDGTWTDTPVTPPNQNPITNPPYQNPNNVPTRSSFGL